MSGCCCSGDVPEDGAGGVGLPTDATPMLADPAVAALVHGAIDVHIHTAPDIYPRRVTSITAAEEAKRAGMTAIVVKSHSTDTAARAELAAEIVGFPVFGGVALNHAVGGLNPYAVRETARQGGRIVWMPTIGARHFVENADLVPMLKSGIPEGVEGISLLSGDRLAPEVDEILDVVADKGLTLASGHVSPEETGVLFEEARSRGIERLVVTHPQANFVAMGDADMLALAGLGAHLEITPLGSLEERDRIIRMVGPRRCLISTDGGTVHGPPPVDRLAENVSDLRRLGYDDAEVRHMVTTVPAYLLGLADLPGEATAGAAPTAG